jgi:hypothetical protein
MKDEKHFLSVFLCAPPPLYSGEVGERSESGGGCVFVVKYLSRLSTLDYA